MPRQQLEEAGALTVPTVEGKSQAPTWAGLVPKLIHNPYAIASVSGRKARPAPAQGTPGVLAIQCGGTRGILITAQTEATLGGSVKLLTRHVTSYTALSTCSCLK